MSISLVGDGSDFTTELTETEFSDEVEILVRTKEFGSAKLVSLAEDEGEKVAIVEFENGDKRIRKLKQLLLDMDNSDVDSDEVGISVITKSKRRAKLIMQAEDEGELVALIQYDDTGETRVTRQVQSQSDLSSVDVHQKRRKHSSMTNGSLASQSDCAYDISRSRYSRSVSDMLSVGSSRMVFSQKRSVADIPTESSYAHLSLLDREQSDRRTRTVERNRLVTPKHGDGSFKAEERSQTHWKCDSCRFTNLDSSTRCLMCRRPHPTRSRKAVSAKFLNVTGRKGYNEDINGRYERVDDFFQGKYCYLHVESDCCIYWSRRVRRWIFDYRGFMNDSRGCAVSEEDVPSPHLVSKPWIVYSGTHWEIDPDMQVSNWFGVY